MGYSIGGENLDQAGGKIESIVQSIDRSLVAIFDIEGFSKENPKVQAMLVDSFIRMLDKSMKDLAEFKPDAFSTGDGAIVSIGRECAIDSNATKRFLDFVIRFTSSTLQKGLIIRTAVNYSEKDRVIVLDDSVSIQGKYIQIGDTINTAARIINFCDPREIMISKSVFDLLRKLDLEAKYGFHKNERYITKHNEELDTYTYEPSQEEIEYIYSPKSVSHPYKKYGNFPPIKSPTIELFIENGIDFELRKVISSAYESIKSINETKTLMSWNQVLNVLMQLKYDPEDRVYVMSRNDRASGFWTQNRRKLYVDYLRSNAELHDGYINQTRIMVYGGGQNPKPEDDIHHDLKTLHNTNTYYSFPSSQLFKYERLDELIFGFTLSTKYHCAIIPVPSGETIENHRWLGTGRMGEMLRFHKDYNVTDGPLKAIITADKSYVQALIGEFESLLKESQIHKIK